MDSGAHPSSPFFPGQTRLSEQEEALVVGGLWAGEGGGCDSQARSTFGLTL